MSQPSRRWNDAKAMGLPFSTHRGAVSKAQLRLHAEVPETEVSRRVATLLAKIHDHSAVVGIVGLGYVGLPLMTRFVEQGFRVIGFDVDAERVALLNRGESPIRHIPAAGIACAAGN